MKIPFVEHFRNMVSDLGDGVLVTQTPVEISDPRIIAIPLSSLLLLR